MSDLAHSTWSASGFEAIMLCPGKKVMEQGKPNSTSKYAAEGTAAHQVLTWALQESLPASAFIGRVIEADNFIFEVDDDMARYVQVCVDYCRDLAGDDGVLFADIRVNYSSYLAVDTDQAWGTADVIIARGDEIMTVDFKYGMGVEVSAEKNPQMSLYALGALQAYQGICGEFTRVRMAISQPRIRTAPSEWDCSVEELEAWGHTDARKAVNTARTAIDTVGVDQDIWDATFLRPTEKGCKFCRAKATCSALRNEVSYTTSYVAPATPEEFANAEIITESIQDVAISDASWLAACLGKVDMIEDWCKAIRAETERRLLAGAPVPGYKLVQGKRGSRTWSNAATAEATLKQMRVKVEEMYDFKLISPTSAEKLAKAEIIGKRQWPKLQELITQSEGKPHVAPVTDARPALDIKPVVDDFADESLA